MIHHRIKGPARTGMSLRTACSLANSCNLHMRSACSWNKVLCEGKPTSSCISLPAILLQCTPYIPLGWSKPSLVPWPPASNNMATLPEANRSQPTSSHCLASVDPGTSLCTAGNGRIFELSQRRPPLATTYISEGIKNLPYPRF